MADFVDVPRAGSRVALRRELPVPLERLYEHLLDWQHLAHVHRPRIEAVRCLHWGAWGWRAEVTLASGADHLIELRLDRRQRRWRAWVERGFCRGSELRGLVVARQARRITVTLALRVDGDGGAQPDPLRHPAPEHHGHAWLAGVWQEAEAMMVERQRQLDRRLDRSRPGERVLDLGPRAALVLPRSVTLAGREFVVVEVAGTLVAFPRQCPHQLGPLDAGELRDGVVTCPWHGYRFDVTTGRNVSGQHCRLDHLPRVSVGADGHVRLTAAH
jgi:nitrite reductase/ring-hydroxylating ferredoxin subunit